MNRLLATLSLTAAALLLSAATPSDPLLTTVIAGARAVPPATIAFERTARTMEQEKGGGTESRVQTDRWDGQRFTVLTINGKTPTAAETSELAKGAAGRPVPGYHRLAAYLANARRVPDAQGRIIYRAEGLPKGSVNIGRDVSANVVAEAQIDSSGAQPYVSRLHLSLSKPMSFMMVARLDALDVVNDYRPGPGGRPALVRQVQTISGSQFGKTGTTRTESTFTPIR